ncbi:MAG TPA: hypothetical protein VGI98_07695 [Candidatus Limnocylindrales bacterium]|jgi:hypothetical protein
MSTIEDAHQDAATPLALARWSARLDRIVAGLFVLVLCVPGAAIAAGFKPPPPIENRPVAEVQRWSLGSIFDTDWYASVDAAITDRLVLRSQAIAARGRIELATGGTGTVRVLRGTGNWMFFSVDMTTPCALDVGTVVSSLDKLHDRFAAAGQRFFVLVGPDKSAIYGDKLPADVALGCTADNRPAIESAAAARPWLIDAWHPLLAARTATPAAGLYFPQDTHWTPLGESVAVQPLIDAIDPGAWADPAVGPSGHFTKTMDLAREVGLPVRREVPNIRRGAVAVTRTIVPVPGISHGPFLFTMHTDAPHVVPGRTLVISDSFLRIDPYVVGAFFADSVWVPREWLDSDPGLLARLGPFDTVILSRVERHLYDESFGPLLARAIR